VNKDFIVARPDLDPAEIRLIMIAEAPTADDGDHFYGDLDGSFFRKTQAVFAGAGFSISDYVDLTALGVYLTTAIKCSKRDYVVATDTLKRCSHILQQEIDQFPNVRVIMSKGDFAIKTINYIAGRASGTRVIPAGPTYKIRQGTFELNGVRYFPSYTHTGLSFGIEKSKRAMIAEDIKRAVACL
jgi:uracil-DNA glycosylase